MMKKTLRKIALALALLTLTGGLCTCENSIQKNRPPEEVYADAVELYENGNYSEAFDLFITLGDYEDVKNYVSRYRILCKQQIEVGSTGTQTLTYTYDSEGVLVKRRWDFSSPDGADRTTVYSYDNAGKITKAVTSYDTGGKSTLTYTYDAKGNLVITKDDGVLLHEYEYDSRGNMTKDIYMDTSVTTYKYDSQNRKTERHWKNSYRDEHTATYTYNKLGQLEKEEVVYYDDGKFDERITYLYYYDRNGRLIKKEREGGYEIIYTYNEDGNLVSESRSGSDALAYTYTCTYDAFGNLTKEEKKYVSTGNKYVTEYSYCGIYEGK